jgi:hypothetical protein
MRWLGGVFMAVVLPLLLSEFIDWCPWFARRLVQRAVCRLPKSGQARWKEEWLEHLEALDGASALDACEGTLDLRPVPKLGTNASRRPAH